MNKYQEALDYINKSICTLLALHGIQDEQVIKNLHILQELVDKETPKKLIRYNHSNEWHCPTCGSGNGEYEGTVGTHNYCHYCGQKLDWSDEFENN